MSALTIYNEDGEALGATITDHENMAKALAEINVQFERWQASQPLAADAGQDEVLAAYKSDIDKLNEQYGFQSVDVVALQADNPKKAEMRGKFLDEHIHKDFEIRFFVDGSGVFYLHANNQVYVTLCEKGDLISVPANTTHWFDMGENPSFKCIRFFTTENGWEGHFTGSDIAKGYPSFDEYVANI